ncbi:protein MIGRI [Parachitinimonas caeni]|uniref:Uncharacterized protein n=1 Tax=Parachitinimonas caeni TaxID=3031301 RepID=A0ABT7DQV3_9NEIS|nr:hypothetical protein [Parachitinimonas caeni]MDK2122452.1 hypothetical protein [Parachitinimonas caeni]
MAALPDIQQAASRQPGTIFSGGIGVRAGEWLDCPGKWMCQAKYNGLWIMLSKLFYLLLFLAAVPLAWHWLLRPEQRKAGRSVVVKVAWVLIVAAIVSVAWRVGRGI